MEQDHSVAQRILDVAQEAGASLAGWVPVSTLREAALDLVKPVAGSTKQGSLLVLAVEHPPSEPELDWWGGEAGTEGNRRLIAISEQVKAFAARLGAIEATPLPYDPWKGGVLLKDAAVLAGLGCIGANNLLVTPRFGPCVRLRAVHVDLRLPSLPKLDFNPCAVCRRPCWKACPQQAFASGAYEKSRCARQMELDEASPINVQRGGARLEVVPYCRACELACPVGRDSRA